MRWTADTIQPRVRVISDNDYCGDPDGLVQLAHHYLSPSVDLRCVIGSQLSEQYHGPNPTGLDDSVAAALHVAELAGRRDVPIVAGASAAPDAIVAEAMRDDTDLPLYVVCGGGLTSLASAWLREPGIAERVTVVWIGGREHAGLAEPAPGDLSVEYNTSIDLAAAQVVFNQSDLAVWQVPRDAYKQVLASRAELAVRMRSQGALGAHLFDELMRGIEMIERFGLSLGETYVLGDSPLVLFTALLGGYDPRPTSSRWVDRPRPTILETGHNGDPIAGAPPLRIFTHLDTRMLLEDLYAKLALHAAEA
jgi:purine nucleosidase